MLRMLGSSVKPRKLNKDDLVQRKCGNAYVTCSVHAGVCCLSQVVQSGMKQETPASLQKKDNNAGDSISLLS